MTLSLLEHEKRETSHLRLIGKTTISPTKAGSRISQNNKAPFDWVSHRFDEWNVQTILKDTDEVQAHVYQQVRHGTYRSIFGSLNRDLNLFSFETHRQIKDFVRNSPGLLHPKGYATHFLFNNKQGEHFVANVYRRYSGRDLCVGLDEFSSDYTWYAFNAHHIVTLVKTMETQS